MEFEEHLKFLIDWSQENIEQKILAVLGIEGQTCVPMDGCVSYLPICVTHSIRNVSNYSLHDRHQLPHWLQIFSKL